MVPLNDVKNIIFDLGGVIINLDMMRTLTAFRELAGTDDVPQYTYEKQHSLFKEYEVGAISTQQLHEGVRQLIGKPVADADIDAAWNAMILDIPPERFELLKQLKTRYRIFLLSNTNEIHYDCFNAYIKTAYGMDGLEPYFEQVYYSHLIGMRKPNADIFEHVLNQNGLLAEETLFLDDTPGHLEGAAKLGLQTMLVTPDNGILHIFKDR